MPPPGLRIYFLPHVAWIEIVVTQIGFYRNIRLPGLIKVRRIVLEISLRNGFCALFRHRVTLTFDLVTPKLIVSCPCPADHLCDLNQNRFIRFQNIVFTFGKKTNKRTDEETDNVRTLCPACHSGLAKTQKVNIIFLAVT